jgi:hypothetical protein
MKQHLIHEESTRKTRHRWAEIIKMDLGGNRIGWYELDLSGTSQGPVEGSCEYDNELSSSTKC